MANNEPGISSGIQAIADLVEQVAEAGISAEKSSSAVFRREPVSVRGVRRTSSTTLLVACSSSAVV